MMRPSKAWIGWLCLVVAATFPTMAAEEGAGSGKAATSRGESAKAEPEVSPFVKAMGGRRSSKKGKVYSNSDLERMYGGGSIDEEAGSDADADADAEEGVPTETTGAAADRAEDKGENKDALSALLEREQARKEHARKVADAEKQVMQARQHITDLEQRKLALKNPFLARPDAPEENAEQWQAMDGDQRVHQTEIEMQSARNALAEAEAELDRLRGSGP